MLTLIARDDLRRRGVERVCVAGRLAERSGRLRAWHCHAARTQDTTQQDASAPDSKQIERARVRQPERIDKGRG